MRQATPPDDIRKLLNKSLAQGSARVAIGDEKYHLMTSGQRNCWFGGVVACLFLLALYGWMAHRDEAARIADRQDRQIKSTLARARCDQADGPLEKVVGPIATQVGSELRYECVYVTNQLMQVPQLRFTKAAILEATK